LKDKSFKQSFVLFGVKHYRNLASLSRPKLSASAKGVVIFMGNIWLSSKKRFGSLEIVITILIFVAVMVWFNVGYNSIKISTSTEQLNEARQTISKAVVLCYSIEGVFPPDIDYLKDNYGLVIDEGKYIVHYDAFASNLMPEITLFRR